MKPDCVVNVATGVHARGQVRLLEGLAGVGFEGDRKIWTNELPSGSPRHDAAPFGFKPFAIREAIGFGYRNVLWLDANNIPVRRLDGIFRKIRKDGYYLFSLGASFGEWCSDSALRAFGVGRERSFSILELCASCIGISAESPVAMTFLDEWCAFALDGSTFRGIGGEHPLETTFNNDGLIMSSDPRVKGHRHDQTCASFLAWKHRMRLSSMEVANHQSVGVFGENVYSKTIPLSAAVVQCRDAKREQDDFLAGTDKYGNTAGPARLRFLALSVAATVRKYVAFRRMRSLMRRKDYYSDPSSRGALGA